jgi:hypothetical protein
MPPFYVLPKSSTSGIQLCLDTHDGSLRRGTRLAKHPPHIEPTSLHTGTEQELSRSSPVSGFPTTTFALVPAETSRLHRLKVRETTWRSSAAPERRAQSVQGGRRLDDESGTYEPREHGIFGEVRSPAI